MDPPTLERGGREGEGGGGEGGERGREREGEEGGREREGEGGLNKSTNQTHSLTHPTPLRNLKKRKVP